MNAREGSVYSVSEAFCVFSVRSLLGVYSVSGNYWLCILHSTWGTASTVPVVRLIADYDTSGQRDATVLYLYHYWVEVDLSMLASVKLFIMLAGQSMPLEVSMEFPSAEHFGLQQLTQSWTCYEVNTHNQKQRMHWSLSDSGPMFPFFCML